MHVSFATLSGSTCETRLYTIGDGCKRQKTVRETLHRETMAPFSSVEKEFV